MRIIMLGDVVGEPGLAILEKRLPFLATEYSADFTVVNGENALGGFGLSAETLDRILAAGADAVTGGNHIWEKREFWPVLDREKRVLRPMNYPETGNGQCPGRGWVKIDKPSGQEAITWLVVNLQGREFMNSIDCPFKAFDAIEERIKNRDFSDGGAHCDETPGAEPESNPVILVDFHAESTREKEALAYYLDGRVSAIAGTHTHVQTADERILPNSSAYITDLGMTGMLDGIIGMDPKVCLDRARNQVLYRMETAASGGKPAIQGVIVEIDGETKKAVSIRRVPR